MADLPLRLPATLAASDLASCDLLIVFVASPVLAFSPSAGFLVANGTVLSTVKRHTDLQPSLVTTWAVELALDHPS